MSVVVSNKIVNWRGAWGSKGGGGAHTIISRGREAKIVFMD